MSQVEQNYAQVQFKGVRAKTFQPWTGKAARPPREAPSPSIFSGTSERHAAVISPADRLLLEGIFQKLQLNGGAYRQTAMARRIPACLRALQARSPGEALHRLREHPSMVEAAINALLIGVTSFFRDPPVFDHLRQTALPELLRRSPAPRLLSVGCSDGSEVYSLAICLMELGTQEGALAEGTEERTGRGFEIQGIDFRARALQKAKAAHYAQEALQDVPEALRGRYFESRGTRVRVKEEVTRHARFAMRDAFIQLLPGPFDLVSCRNLAIYLEHPAAARLWRRLHGALRPGGLLLTGKAEVPTAGFVRMGPCLFRKAEP